MVALPRAKAFLVFNEGRDQVFVNATYTFGFDSNIFYQQAAQGSATQTMSVSANYVRRAGIINVDATATVTAELFSQVRGQDVVDPDFSLVLTKGVGRTTGSLNLEAQRESSPDPLTNSRPISWDYTSALDLRYPVNDRYYFTSASGVALTDYQNQLLYSDLDSYSENLGINYIYNSKLDLTGSYAFRLDDTPGITAYDHSFNLGATGSILPKLSVSLSAGFETRTSSSKADGNETFDGIDANLNLYWRYSRLITVNEAVIRDYSITSTDIQTDTTSSATSIEATFAHRWRTSAGATVVNTEFLGRAGGGRRDWLLEFPVNLGTAITTHLKTNLTYSYEVNYSNVSSAQFVAQTLSLTISASY
jgi:hypothetical protein